jgi:hypothetical protein
MYMQHQKEQYTPTPSGLESGCLARLSLAPARGQGRRQAELGARRRRG